MTLPEKICMLPWISIETSPTGGARPCCMFREEIKQPNGERYLLTETPLSEIYNSEYMQQLRRDFRDGNLPDNCSTCWNEENAGRQSKRMSTFYRLKEVAKEVDWENDTPNQLKFIDLKLGNICNLKCRICGSWSSSKWAEEELAYNPEVNKKDHLAYTFLRQGQWPRKSPKFWDDLRSLLPEIVYFEFTGGEPFLIEQHFDLLRFAIAEGHANNIEIHYNTNATTLPEDAIEIWKHFKTVEIAFSIDNVGKRFEYERYGAKWDRAEEIIKTVNSMRTQYPMITTQVCLTVNAFNVFYLEELCEWVIKQKFNYNYFNLLHGEPEFRIDRMTPRATEEAIRRLENGKFPQAFKQDIQNLINFIKLGTPTDGVQFITKVKRTDEYRKESLAITHSELAEAMGYND